MKKGKKDGQESNQQAPQNGKSGKANNQKVNEYTHIPA